MRQRFRSSMLVLVRLVGLVVLLGAAAGGLSPASVSAQPARGAAAGPPPIIDRELFFGDPEIAGAQISPDGQYIAFLKPYKGTRNIWVKKATDPFSAARPVSAEPTRPIPGYF